MFFESPLPHGELGFPADLTAGYRWLTRQLMMLGGVAFVVVGVAGIFLPLVPTTGPLLVASLLFAHGSPRFRNLLHTNSVTGRYLKYADGTEKIPIQARIGAVVWLWCGLLFGLYALSTAGYLNGLITVPYIVGGVSLTVVIFSYRSTFLKQKANWRAPPLDNKIGHDIGSRTRDGGCSFTIDSALLEEVLALSNSIHQACSIPSQAPANVRFDDSRTSMQVRDDNSAQHLAVPMKDV